MSKQSVIAHREKIRREFLSDVPSHYTPEFFSGRVQDDPACNPYTILRLCRFDIDTLINALNCLEHWVMTKEIGDINSLFYGGDEQVHHRLELKTIVSLIDFLKSVRVVGVDDSDAIPF